MRWESFTLFPRDGSHSHLVTIVPSLMLVGLVFTEKTTILFCHVTLRDQIIKGLCGWVSDGPSIQVTIVLSLIDTSRSYGSGNITILLFYVTSRNQMIKGPYGLVRVSPSDKSSNIARNAATWDNPRRSS